MFDSLTLVNVIFLLASWLLIGSVTYGHLTLKGWREVAHAPTTTDIPADIRAAAEGWAAAQRKNNGADGHPLAEALGDLFGSSWTRAPVVLEWAALNTEMSVPTNAWLPIFFWPIVLFKSTAKLIAKGVNAVLLPEVRERSVKVMREYLQERETREQEQRTHKREDFDAINKLLNEDRGDDFGPVAQLL